MIRILVADDHAIVREGLKQIVADTDDIVVVDEASSGQEALNKVLENYYDVVVLDIGLPDMNGLDVLKELKRRRPEIRVLILSIYPEDQYAIRALRAGASGYLTKESVPEELVAAIRRVSTGHKYISSFLAEKLAYGLEATGEKLSHQTLSDREFQVMCLIASGKSVGEIAEALFLSVKTISTYRTRVLQKIGVRNSVELTRYAIENRLVP